MNTVKLNNNVEMPQIGYGVYQVSYDEQGTPNAINVAGVVNAVITTLY